MTEALKSLRAPAIMAASVAFAGYWFGETFALFYAISMAVYIAGVLSGMRFG